MTSASSSIENKKARFLPLFNFTLRQRWTTGLLIAIILFFTLPVPVMMVLSSVFKHGGTDVYESAMNSMLEWSTGIRFVLIPLLSVLAVVMTCAMFGYLKSKVPVDFYHSLPIKRGRLYANQLLSGYFLLMLPFIIMLIAAAGVLLFHGLLSAAIIKSLLLTFGECVIFTLFFYGLGTLVGMASGLTSVHLVLTCTAIFIVPFLYVVSVFFVAIFNENMWADWYCNEGILARLSPALRFVFNTERLGAVECVVYLILAAALLIGAYAVYLHRKSERAGMSVVFNPLGEVIKYLLVFPMTLLGGLFFYSLMDSFAWTVFGMVCGGLLTFMLTNTILHKTAKAMFRGWKGLCLYGGVIVLCLIALTTNLFGINSNVPKPEATSKVEVNLGNGTRLFEFSNPEAIKALYEIYTEGDWRWRALYDDTYGEYTEPAKYYGGGNRLELQIVFYPKVGVPTAKSVIVYNKNEFAEQLKTILDGAEFKSQYAAMLKNAAGFANNYNGAVDIMGFDGKGNVYSFYENYYYGNSYGEVNNSRNRLLAALVLDTQDVGFDDFQQTSFGYIRTPIKNNLTVYFPIYADMVNVRDTLYEEGYTNTPVEKQADMLADCIDKLTVTELSSGDTRTYSDPDKIKAIISAVSSVKGYDYESPFTLIDTGYTVNYTLRIIEVYKDRPADIVSGEETFSEYEYASTFLLGKIPAFVTSDFGK